MDADDIQGALMTAVMSYEAWQHDYAGDTSVVGSTFWVNTKPAKVVGIAPEGLYGDRTSTTYPQTKPARRQFTKPARKALLTYTVAK